MPGSRSTRPGRGPRLGPDGIDVWCADPESVLEPALRGRCEALLAPDERRRYLEVRPGPRRREYLAGRALVRTALSRYRPVAPADWAFRAGARGRPEPDPENGLRFNLSHCDGLVVCAVAEGRAVGVDAEPEARAAAVARLAPRVLSPEEIAGLERLAGGEARALRALELWTLKESYAKALGVGLSIPLRRINFTLREGGIRVATDRPSDDPRWEFRLLRVVRHRVALAVERAAGPSKVRIFRTAPLADAP
jgi:4'-phosphopantetheinyl transferase